MKNETHAFIIRVWYESQDRDGNVLAWRGSIDHVGGDQRLYFQDLDGLVRFIQEKSGINNNASSFWRASLAWIKDEINKLRKKRTIKHLD